MGGHKLEITKQAGSRLIRSLGPDDQVAVVVYDDKVDLISGLERPDEHLARRIEAIESSGSTNLYGGWLLGAKVVGSGGRVLLLSDGLANAGTYTDAPRLAAHAKRSFERYGVTTTTIGIGQDYDEALMVGMARARRGRTLLRPHSAVHRGRI